MTVSALVCSASKCINGSTKAFSRLSGVRTTIPAAILSVTRLSSSQATTVHVEATASSKSAAAAASATKSVPLDANQNVNITTSRNIHPATTYISTEISNVNNIRNIDTSTDHSSILFRRAAREAQAILPLLQSNSNDKLGTSVQQQENYFHRLKMAVNLAERLLHVTQSTNASVPQNNNSNKEDMIALHRAFLGVSQLCVSLMETGTNTYSRNAKINANSFVQQDLLEHPLLDHVLQLTQRSHDWGLGFHLPLYQKICQVIASQENSIHSRSAWILKVVQWAQHHLHYLPNDFLEISLLELTEQNSTTETVSILQGMQTLQPQMWSPSLNEQTTKEILLNLKGCIRSMYQKQSSPNANWTLEEEHCLEIILLLESSIWKLAENERFLGEDDPILQQVIEGILNNTEQDLPLLSSSSNDHHRHHQDDLEEFLHEANELVDALEGMEEHDDDDDNDDANNLPLDDPLLLYTRPMECNDSLPDIASQLLKGKNSTKLRYSTNMERHIYFQFCPMDNDENDDDDAC